MLKKKKKREKNYCKSLKNRHSDIRIAIPYEDIHELVAIPTEEFLVPADERTCNTHPHQFYHIATTQLVYHNAFPNTVLEWNEVPAHVVKPPALEVPSLPPCSCRRPLWVKSLMVVCREHSLILLSLRQSVCDGLVMVEWLECWQVL